MWVDYLTDEQSLLEAYLRAKCYVIAETSDRMTDDKVRLRSEVARYAESRGLRRPDFARFMVILDEDGNEI